MQLNQRLLACLSSAAAGVSVDQITIGIGYTAVATSDGAIGIAATDVAMHGCCGGNLDVADFEDRPAMDMLQLIMESDPLARTMALALINALNHRQTLAMPEDPDNALLFDHFGIRSGVRVAMVGFFPPLVRLLEKGRVPLSVIDDAKRLGNKRVFYRQLDGWADVLMITATSIINNSTETILSHAGPGVKTVLLGPSTPMVPEAFAHLPIHMLAGAAITDPQRVMKIVRHSGGTHALKPVTRKIYWEKETVNDAMDR